MPLPTMIAALSRQPYDEQEPLLLRALRDIAMYHMVSEDAVEKAKRRAQDKLLGQINAAENGN